MQTDETIDRYFYITGWICIAIFAALAAVIGVCGTQILTKVPPCPLHAYTGYYCPGCGGTRATFALLHGHLIRSFVLHPFVPYTAVFGGWFMLSYSLYACFCNVQCGLYQKLDASATEKRKLPGCSKQQGSCLI